MRASHTFGCDADTLNSRQSYGSNFFALSNLTHSSTYICFQCDLRLTANEAEPPHAMWLKGLKGSFQLQALCDALWFIFNVYISCPKSLDDVLFLLQDRCFDAFTVRRFFARAYSQLMHQNCLLFAVHFFRFSAYGKTKLNSSAGAKRVPDKNDVDALKKEEKESACST